MNLILKRSGPSNLVLRPQSTPRNYGTATVDPVAVEVYWRYADEAPEMDRRIGIFTRGASYRFQFSFDLDRNIILSTASVSGSGRKDVVYRGDAVQALLVIQRVTEAPVIGQEGASTASQIKLVISRFNRFARQRRLRIADNADMTAPVEHIYNATGENQLPTSIILDRGGAFVPDLIFSPTTDPATVGWTKTGAGTTEASGAGWRINTESSNDETYYSKNGFTGDFSAGFTLYLTPPDITTDDSGSTNDQIAFSVDDGETRFTIGIDATDVSLDHGAGDGHSGQRICLVIHPDLTADLYIGMTQVQSGIAGEEIDRGDPLLRFGDFAASRNADAIWREFEYAFSISPPQLSQTIYMTCAHSGGTQYGPESDVLEASFADEAGDGGSEGTDDPIPRDYTML